jgi:hypothetical protein
MYLCQKKARNFIKVATSEFSLVDETLKVERPKGILGTVHSGSHDGPLAQIASSKSHLNLALPLTSHVALGKQLHLFKTYFSQL